MKRPILVATIGYIIGIIMGLYLKKSIVLFYIPIIAIHLIRKKFLKKKTKKRKFKLISTKRYFRYIKLVLKKNTVICIIIFSILSNTIVILQNYKYETLYQDGENIVGEGIVVSNEKEKEYNKIYKIKVLKANNSKQYKNTYLYLKINKKSTNSIEYGDKIFFEGTFIEPDSQRNEGGFNYKEYLKTLKIYGNIKTNKIEVIEKNKINPIFSFTNKVSLKIKQKINLIIGEKQGAVLKGILLGDSSQIEENMHESFKISSISHILAVSGMHVSYIILAIELVFKSKIGKTKTRIFTSLFLIFYMAITNFSPSVVRAGIMGILVIGSKLFNRKNDTATSVAISLLFILFYNPFLIMNLGLQFSYIGTIGILLFRKNIFDFLRNIKIRNRKWKYKINRRIILLSAKIKEILSITTSVQIAILPIMLFHSNILGTYFLLTNLLVSIIIGPIMILGGIIIIFSFISVSMAKNVSFLIEFLLGLLIKISDLSKLAFSKIYVATPKMWMIILYYVTIFIINYSYILYYSKKLTITQIRARNLIALAKYKIFQNKKKFLKLVVILLSLILIIQITSKKLEIHFIDVGQGDSTLILTPQNKTILIDGGGSTSKEFDVGKSTLLPYILDKGYTKIDYIFISHLDQDHVGGILYLLQEIKVKHIIIGKQFEETENLQKLKEIVKEKKISVIAVEEGDKVRIEKNLYFDILWPNTKEEIKENAINNNATVCKLNYKSFSMLFTGDIEKESEKVLTAKYKETEALKSTVLKVAHHGSKTSSTEEFLKFVNPKIAIIGVGKNNLFGHPNDEVIERLKKLAICILRTDKDGEITITVNKNGKFFVKTNY